MSAYQESQLKEHVKSCVERRQALSAALLTSPVEAEVDHLITVLYEGGVPQVPEQVVLERMVAIDLFDTQRHILGYKKLVESGVAEVTDEQVLHTLTNPAFLSSFLTDEAIPAPLRTRLNTYFTEFLGPHDPDFITPHSRIIDILINVIEA